MKLSAIEVEVCDTCWTTMKVNLAQDVCSTCGGTRRQLAESTLPTADVWVPCAACAGTEADET